MAIDWNDEIVDQLESHWQRQIRPRLDGLTDDEYFWQPVPGCWTISRRGESSAPVSVGAGDFTIDSADEPVSPEPVTTIAWRLGHLLAVLGLPGTPHFDLPAGPPRSCVSLEPRPMRCAGSTRGTMRGWPMCV